MTDLNTLDHEQYIEQICNLARETGDQGNGPHGSLSLSMAK
jgi:hypothetical protein